MTTPQTQSTPSILTPEGRRQWNHRIHPEMSQVDVIEERRLAPRRGVLVAAGTSGNALGDPMLDVYRACGLDLGKVAYETVALKDRQPLLTPKPGLRYADSLAVIADPDAVERGRGLVPAAEAERLTAGVGFASRNRDGARAHPGVGALVYAHHRDDVGAAIRHQLQFFRPHAKRGLAGFVGDEQQPVVPVVVTGTPVGGTASPALTEIVAQVHEISGEMGIRADLILAIIGPRPYQGVHPRVFQNHAAFTEALDLLVREGRYASRGRMRQLPRPPLERGRVVMFNDELPVRDGAVMPDVREAYFAQCGLTMALALISGALTQSWAAQDSDDRVRHVTTLRASGVVLDRHLLTGALRSEYRARLTRQAADLLGGRVGATH